MPLLKKATAALHTQRYKQVTGQNPTRQETGTWEQQLALLWGFDGVTSARQIQQLKWLRNHELNPKQKISLSPFPVPELLIPCSFVTCKTKKGMNNICFCFHGIIGSDKIIISLEVQSSISMITLDLHLLDGGT